MIEEEKEYLNNENSEYPYKLRISPCEILEFKTKEEWVNKVIELITKEIKLTSENRSIDGGY